MIKQTFSFVIAICMVIIGCSKNEKQGGDGDNDERPLKNEYTYNGITKSVGHAYYQTEEQNPFANKYRLLLTPDEIESGGKYKDLEEYIYLEFAMGKHLNQIDYEFEYSDQWPSIWTVEGKFTDGFNFLGLSTETGRICGGSFEFKMSENGMFRIVFNIKVDASGVGGGFRYVIGEYGGTFTPYNLSSY